MIEIIYEHLEKILPHGSGIDSDWNFDTLKNGKVIVSNSFHCMNENGYYCGYADFSIAIDLQNPLDFKLTFHGKFSHYLNSRYMLKDYLEDIIYAALKGN